MNGLQLIAKLQELSLEDLQKEVWTEGCDCWGECLGISVEAEILLTREPNE